MRSRFHLYQAHQRSALRVQDVLRFDLGLYAEGVLHNLQEQGGLPLCATLV